MEAAEAHPLVATSGAEQSRHRLLGLMDCLAAFSDESVDRKAHAHRVAPFAKAGASSSALQL
jgi:hypothetical protein